MKKEVKEHLDELLEIAERISGAKISDVMKDAIFQSFLKGSARPILPSTPPPADPGNGDENDQDNDFEFPASVKRYLRIHAVTPGQMAKVFHLETGNLDYLVSELNVKNNYDGVRECILLVGLKNALASNVCKVVINEVRELAGNHGVYDSANFSSAMKRNADLLKTYKVGEDTELSGPGIKAAMELVKRLAGE